MADLQCNSDAECSAPKSRCVVQADGNYAQCVSCSADDFAHACPFWAAPFLKAAESRCGQDCARLSRNTMADLQASR